MEKTIIIKRTAAGICLEVNGFTQFEAIGMLEYYKNYIITEELKETSKKASPKKK